MPQGRETRLVRGEGRSRAATSARWRIGPSWYPTGRFAWMFLGCRRGHGEVAVKEDSRPAEACAHGVNEPSGLAGLCCPAAQLILGDLDRPSQP